MKLLANALLLAAAATAAAIPTPASEADIDALRAQGLSEHDIAARFPHAHATATLLRRTIDADEEVAPGRFVVTAREIEGHAGLDENSAFGEAVAKHVYAVKAFIDGVMRGRIATAGNGGVPMKRAIEEGEMRPRRWIYHW
ncbi:hypothetical protein GTA08_BOTSDO09722 [Botryosphaeria dothidea]|uniref:Uncharacterized protein n=1 Tax=Botryosphaeria dothidea TaxID=55169 RepID=A0A8H4N028_9PEZI|nr:hypothetical protein GTA08_BOTSDO09722 [Botryosphaeria dothidea]